MELIDKSTIIFAFVVANNILSTFQYEYRHIPIKSIARVGPSLGKMKQLRNAGHILCLKEPEARKTLCDKAFRKLSQLSSKYNMTDEKPPKEFAYRIVYAGKNDSTPQVVFACGCPTEPPGVFLMGWVNHLKTSVVEVLDYQSAHTDPLDKSNFRSPVNETIPMLEMRRHFLVSFPKGQEYLLDLYDKQMKQNATT